MEKGGEFSGAAHVSDPLKEFFWKEEQRSDTVAREDHQKFCLALIFVCKMGAVAECLVLRMI